MKRMVCLLMMLLLLAGCGNGEKPAGELPEVLGDRSEISFESRFGSETVIVLSDQGIDVKGTNAMCVYSDSDIVYYEDRETYDSGNPYGEGEAHERHSADEAAAHVVVHITKPGTYRISGTLSAGQIAVDLGEDAYEDPNAVVELILDGADITCTVAPAIVFYNVYECDGDWSADTAKAEVDTSAAGANLVLAEGSDNFVTGSHVARISYRYRHKELCACIVMDKISAVIKFNMRRSWLSCDAKDPVGRVVVGQLIIYVLRNRIYRSVNGYAVQKGSALFGYENVFKFDVA